MKLLCLVLALTLLLGTPALAERDDPIARLASDWTMLQSLRETRFAQELFALNAIVTFSQTLEWDDLNRARVACLYTETLMEHLADMPIEESMTAEDYETLEAQGYDLDDVASDYRIYRREMKDLREHDLPQWRGLYIDALMWCAYFDPIPRMLGDLARTSAALIELELELYELTDQIVMMNLPESDARQIKAFSAQHMPLIMSMRKKEHLAVNDALNALKDVIADMEDAMAAYENTVVQVSEALEHMDLSVNADIHGMPTFLPVPVDWLGAVSSIRYYWVNEGGDVTVPKAQMRYDAPPTNLAMVFTAPGGMTRAQYVSALAAVGYPLSAQSATIARFVFENGARLLISEEDDTVTLSVSDGELCLVPEFYVPD